MKAAKSEATHIDLFSVNVIIKLVSVNWYDPEKAGTVFLLKGTSESLIATFFGAKNKLSLTGLTNYRDEDQVRRVHPAKQSEANK